MPLLFVGFIVVTLTATRIYAFKEEQEQFSGNVLIHDVALTTQVKTIEIDVCALKGHRTHTTSISMVKTNHWRIYDDAPLLGLSFT